MNESECVVGSDISPTIEQGMNKNERNLPNNDKKEGGMLLSFVPAERKKIVETPQHNPCAAKRISSDYIVRFTPDDFRSDSHEYSIIESCDDVDHGG